MTLLIVLAVFGPPAIVALFWCLRGFSRELKRGRKVIGVVVHVETTGGRDAVESHLAPTTGNVIAIARRTALHSGRSA